MKRVRRTKIIATLGPSSSTREMIHALATAGVNVFRLNFSHGNHETHAQNIQTIRAVEETLGRPVGILADLQGPKLRISTFERDQKFTLVKGESFTLCLDEVPGNASQVTLPHAEIFEAASVGTVLLINDGLVKLCVREKMPRKLLCDVLVGGEISSKKGVNIPGVHLPLSAITKKDSADLAFILTQNVDWIALSFVQTGKDVRALREQIPPHIKIIAKIEKPLALKHLKDIVEESDALMVARGDLGVELPLEDVPLVQKKIIKACRKAGKPVVVATQMLESMIHQPTPTRAEVSDVAGAIFDQVDAVMLSAESASGNFPVEAVSMMSRIIHGAEREQTEEDLTHFTPSHFTSHASFHEPLSTSSAITAAAREITHHLRIPVIVTVTGSGATTLAAAKERPHAAIFALTQNQTTARQLSLCWGAYAVTIGEVSLHSKDLEHMAIDLVRTHHLAQKGDRIILTAGVPFEQGSTHFLKVVELG